MPSKLETDGRPRPSIGTETSEHAATAAATYAHGRSQGTGPSEGEGLYQLLVETVQDYAIFALDPTGHVLNWNAGAERLKGYRPEEIIGKHFSEFYLPEDLYKPEYELEVAKRDGRVEDEGWRVRKDGTTFWANVVITALRNSTGQLVGFAKVTRDLTERRAAEHRAIDAARRLATSEYANKAKADFLAAMSHELRTPLNAIGGYSDLLLTGIGGGLEPQQTEYVTRIKISQQRLLSVINDILNFSRIEAGRLAYDIKTHEIENIIATVFPLIEPQAASNGVVLNREACPGLKVSADRERVEQILVNLLSNAVKFTDAGGTVSVWCEEHENKTLLHVRDSGSGIPAEDLGQIFQPFVQVGRSLTNTREGAGLGLAISSDLATAMKGELTVSSELGKGSTFTLALPTHA